MQTTYRCIGLKHGQSTDCTSVSSVSHGSDQLSSDLLSFINNGRYCIAVYVYISCIKLTEYGGNIN